MISVEEAKRIMMEHMVRMEGGIVPFDEALGRYAAEDVIAPVDHPLFTCSAVDGYAFAFDEQREWKVVMEVAAGEAFDGTIRPGECARIFTGAMLPIATDTVVMQEFVLRDGDLITHTDVRLKKGANVRLQGEQLRAGAIAHRRGELCSPQAIGLLAGSGITGVHVRTPPRVVVIASGSEFNSGGPLLPGKIFSSNDVMLIAALRDAGVPAVASQCPDDVARLASVIRDAIVSADVVITTGGVSVGDHDLILPVLKEVGARIFFHNVAQKPGKPMLFATLNGKPIFGLPGNPRAVMILFWEYVLPFLHAMQGATDPWLRSDHLPMTQDLELKGERAEFRAAKVKEGKVVLLADEGSHMLRSLIDADALAYFPAHTRSVRAGDSVEVHYLPR